MNNLLKNFCKSVTAGLVVFLTWNNSNASPYGSVTNSTNEICSTNPSDDRKEVGSEECTFIIDLNFNNVTCSGANDGEATIDPVGYTQPLSYKWSNGEETFIAVVSLEPGEHSITVVDGAGCVVVETFNISEPDPLEVILEAKFPHCNSLQDNTLAAIVSGGKGNPTYRWSNNSTTKKLSELTEGVYTVTVTDENGCTNSAQIDFALEDNESPAVSFTDSINLYIDASGNIDLSPLNIKATDNCSTVTISTKGDMNCEDLGFRTWTCTATDESGNETKKEIHISGVIDTISPIVSYQEDISQDGCDSIFYELPQVFDNCGVVSLELVAGLPSGSIFPQGSTTITYQFYDAAGNSAACSFQVVSSNDLTLVIDEVRDATPSEGGEVDVTTEGGAGSVTFEWIFNDSMLVSNFEDVRRLDPGSYVVNVTDETGCNVRSNDIVIGMISATIDEVGIDFMLSPNPVRDILTLRTNKEYERIKIYNINGQFVLGSSKQENSNVMRLNVEELKIGLYFLQVEFEEGTRILKFVKK